MEEMRGFFAMGAVSASLLCLFTLTPGLRSLAPLIKNPLAWKIMNLAIALIMFFIAITLLLGVFE